MSAEQPEPLPVMPVGKDARDYQLAAARQVLKDYEKPQASTLVVLPTGTGKTTCAVIVTANYQHGRTLFLAPSEEIVRQTAAEFKAALPHLKTCIEMQEHRSHRRQDADVVVATVGSMLKRLPKYQRNHFQHAILDEAHHSTSKSWRTILDHFAPGLKHTLGLTATPDRHDGVALGNVFQSTAYEMQITEAQDLGWLVQAEQQYAPSCDIDLRSVHRQKGDFNQSELAAVMERQQAVEHIVQNTIRIADGRKTALYCLSVQQAKQVAERLRQLGEPHIYIDGKTPKFARKERIDSFAHGRAQFLVNCAACTEGLDVRQLEVIAMSRPTQSRNLFAQIVGRGLRPFVPPQGLTPAERLEELKQQGKRALVLDFVGNTGKHLLVCLGDILGGTFDDEVRREARRIASASRQPVDMRDAYRRTQEMVERRRQKRVAKQNAEPRQQLLQDQHGELLRTYRPHPYDVLSIERRYAAAAIPQRSAYGARQQDAVKTLEENELKTFEIQKLTNQEQIFLADVLQSRKQGGLCTWRQARLLHKHGYDPSTMSFRDARRKIARLALFNWKRPPEDGPNPTLDQLIGTKSQGPEF